MDALVVHPPGSADLSVKWTGIALTQACAIVLFTMHEKSVSLKSDVVVSAQCGI